MFADNSFERYHIRVRIYFHLSRGNCESLRRAFLASNLIGMNGMKPDEACQTHAGGDWMSEEEIDYNLMGTFPASDPPSWTLGVGPYKTSCEEFEGEPPSPHDPSHQNEPSD